MDKKIMIDTIVFDLGAVLIDWNPRYLYNQLFITEDATEHFLFNVCTTHWNEQQDAGRKFSDATDLLIAQHPHYNNEIKAYYDRWEEMLKGPISEMVDLFKELKISNKYKLYALTNWSAESFPVALQKFEFLSWFDGIVVSGEEKMKKPDEKIFNLLISRYNLDVKTTLFIDDNNLNITTAKGLGFKCVHFIESDNSIPLIKNLL